MEKFGDDHCFDIVSDEVEEMLPLIAEIKPIDSNLKIFYNY